MLYDGSRWYMFGHGLGMLFWLIILVLVIWFLVSLISGKSTDELGVSAKSILAERYARGEIDEEEYQKRKLFLDKSGE